MKTNSLQNEESLNSYSSNTASEETNVLISREGRRRQHGSTSYKMRLAAIQNNNRRRKTDQQVSTLVRIFDKYDGKLTKEMKEESIRKTGLAWIQIYKWVFDHKVKKANLDRAYRLHYPF